MIFKFLGKLKFFIIPIFLVLSFSSCVYKNPITGSNNFHYLVSKLVADSVSKIKKNISLQEAVLVSDFVNLDKLKNKSQLGFLLSSMLKDSLVSQNIIVREIELGKEFEFGANGFNLLTRNKDNIASNKITKPASPNSVICVFDKANVDACIVKAALTGFNCPNEEPIPAFSIMAWLISEPTPLVSI